MSLARILVLTVMLGTAATGCLRVGPGEDLALVCEPKTRAPGPAYGPEDLLRLTTWDDAALAREDALALVTLAQPHVITMSRVPHHALQATLGREDDLWRFHAQGNTTNGTRDEYDVLIEASTPPNLVTEAVQPPASVVAAATDAVEREPSLAPFRERAPTLLRATWEAENASCVTLHYAGPETLVVNVVQARVVQIS